MTLTFPLILLLAFAGAMCVVLFAWGFLLMASKTQVAAEESVATGPKKNVDDTFILHRATQALGKPFLPQLRSIVGPEREASIQKRIESAGTPENLNVERYLQRKAGEVLLYGSVALLLFLRGSPLIAAAALAFIFMTDLSLFSEARKRQDKIQQQLPDFLDVLAVTVGAGLSFRQALSRVSDSMPGVLADEFRHALRQMDLGTNRRDAFTEMRTRNSNDSLGRFVSALQQAEELGAPLADALVTISSDIRREDAQYLRRKAQNLNPKVTGITAATMLPGLIILVGGGMFLGLDIDFSGLTGG